jgi:hypothetical protein
MKKINFKSKMESGDHLSNGAILKSQMSRGNFSRIILTIAAILFAFTSFAQEDYEKDPKANERVPGIVTGKGTTTGKTIHLATYSYNVYHPNIHGSYMLLLEKAKKEYPNKVIDLRNLTCDDGANGYLEYPSTDCSAKVVEFVSPETQWNETLVKAVDEAMSKVRVGSRLAIDQVSVTGSKLNRETVKDQLIDVLLEKDYKVVAKEYLEKLKEEQVQQAKDHNERTTAQTENFSGAGYFLNVRVNEKSIRVQVVNVSTGEYEETQV